jgi:hypothetical protein
MTPIEYHIMSMEALYQYRLISRIKTSTSRNYKYRLTINTNPTLPLMLRTASPIFTPLQPASLTQDPDLPDNMPPPFRLGRPHYEISYYLAQT